MIIWRFGKLASIALLALGGGVASAQQSGMIFFVTGTGSGKGADFGGLSGASTLVTPRANKFAPTKILAVRRAEFIRPYFGAVERRLAPTGDQMQRRHADQVEMLSPSMLLLG